MTRSFDRVFDPPLRSQDPGPYFFPVRGAAVNSPLDGHTFSVGKVEIESVIPLHETQFAAK